MFDNKDYENISSSSNTNTNSDSNSNSDDTTNSVASYEWNGDEKASSINDGVYRHSYVNGQNENADHNPNRYNNYSANNRSYTEQSQQNYYQNNNPYSTVQTNQPNANNNVYYANAINQNQPIKTQKAKKPKKPVTVGVLVASLVCTMVVSAGLGFGGGYVANKLNTTTDGNIVINKVNQSENSSSNVTNISSSNSTSDIVQKTADSVVEIVTESVVKGTFNRSYISEGAGSGVIISKDGYILTNYHVIENANSVKVTLRNGTEYDAKIIGSDYNNDIALVKVNANDLSAATFGDSSNLSVGAYVVAIGNPLGELGGTVTDGIISALAREVTIDNRNMTLLQTNAQVNPGNSGGGLFNANGELIGIVNAKDSATEIEGIAFAIPINNVLDILDDLKNYGYVTGRVDLGFDMTDITSDTTAFYYGVNQTGCYVLSVDNGSNAEKAGVTRGDLITKVNGENVSKSADVDKILEKAEVGDKVTVTVYRRGKTSEVSFELEEYIPNITTENNNNDDISQYNQGGSSIWDSIFGW